MPESKPQVKEFAAGVPRDSQSRLDFYTREIEELWNNILFDECMLGDFSEQYFLLAVDTLQQAQRHMRLAYLNRKHENRPQ